MQKTIFVVDDSDVNLTQAKRALEGSHRVFTLPSAARMFALLEKITPDLILLDIEMPEVKGDEALVRLRASPGWADIPVVFVTGWNDEIVSSHCLSLGALDILIKPYPNSLLLKRVDNYLRAEDMANRRLEGAGRLANGLVSVMSNVLESREKRAVGHVERVAEYVRLLISVMLAKGVYAAELRTWDTDTAVAASRMHDIGKIAVPEAILNKSAPLTQEEHEILWTHAAAGERIIDDLIARTGDDTFTAHARRFAGTHHENWDGSGYPNGLSGEQIPLEGRVLSVADIYDKMIFGSSTYPAVEHRRAVEFIQKDTGSRFDPRIVPVFLEIQHSFDQASEAFKAQFII